MPNNEGKNKQRSPKSASPRIGREKIGQRINELLDEREKLFKELEKHSIRDVSPLFAKELSESPELKQAIQEGLERIRKETEFLKPLDSLGIRVFVDDLENQPSAEDLKIEFDSEQVRRENILNFQGVGGWASRYEGRIEIQKSKPPLFHQVADFLDKGELHPSIQILIHEMIHWSHYMRSTRHRVNGVLTESHAYLTEAVGSRSRGGIASLHELLTDPDSLYNFDPEEAINGLTTVSGLLAQNLSQDEIAHIVANSSYDKDKRKFFPSAKQMNPGHLSSLELQALGDIYRLNLTNQRLKAQLLMYETLKSHFPMEMLKELQLKSLRNGIARPIYYKEGELVPSEALAQLWILPANTEWPYDRDGLRTGIFFGYVKNNENKLEFALGKLSATSKDSTFTPAKTPEEQEHLLSLIREQAPELKDKSGLLNYWFTKYLPSSVLPSKILRAALNKEDVVSFMQKDESFFIQEINMLYEGIQKVESKFLYSQELSEKEARAIRIYEFLIKRYQDILNLFEIDVKEISSDFSDRLESVGRKLERVKQLFDKNQAATEAVQQKVA